MADGQETFHAAAHDIYGRFGRSTWSSVMALSPESTANGAAAAMRRHASTIERHRRVLRRLAVAHRTREPGARLLIRSN